MTNKVAASCTSWWWSLGPSACESHRTGGFKVQMRTSRAWCTTMTNTTCPFTEFRWSSWDVHNPETKHQQLLNKYVPRSYKVFQSYRCCSPDSRIGLVSAHPLWTWNDRNGLTPNGLTLTINRRCLLYMFILTNEKKSIYTAIEGERERETYACYCYT